MASHAAEDIQHELYSLPRGKQESQRLDHQHYVFTRLAGGLIHPSIPKQNLRNIADIATGTGIWLADIAAELGCKGHYVGFDLSDSQFPNPSSLPQGCSFEFKVHDMTRRFPPEYHAQFDLVNIRLVVQALKAVNVSTVISNILELLKPGGHIQWGDVSWSEVKSIPPNTKLDMINEIITGHMKYYGISLSLPDLVEQALRSHGAKDVTRSDSYSDNHQSISKEEGAYVLKEAEMSMLPKALETVRAYIPQTSSFQGMAMRKDAEEELSNWDQTWRFLYTVVTGRRGL